MALIDLPLVHPDHEISGFHPVRAMRHFRRLVADKEDTAQVFHIIETLKGRRSHTIAWDFIRSEQGQAFMRSETDIPSLLDDHQRWAECGPNSVAAQYIAFMKREGLSAGELVAESQKWLPDENRHYDQTTWYFERLRDTHDLFHVLTGYGRDALGETALLGFSYAQNGNLGIKFIAYAGAREIKKSTGTKAPIYAAIKEGRVLGENADMLGHMDIDRVMRMDIAEAREAFNIGVPMIYRECLQILEQERVDSAQVMQAQA